MWFVLYRIYKNSNEAEFAEASACICGDINPGHDYWTAIKFLSSEEDCLKFAIKSIHEFDLWDELQSMSFYQGSRSEEMLARCAERILDIQDLLRLMSNNKFDSFSKMKDIWDRYLNLYSEEYIGLKFGECK